MNKKRILIFSYAYEPLVGGAEIAVREITDRLSPDEYEFEMVTVRCLGMQKVEQVGNVLVHRIGRHIQGGGRIARGIDRVWKIAFPFLAAFKGLALHKKNRFDMAWSIMAAYAGFATLFFHKKTGVPYVLTLQEGDPLEHIRRKTRFVRRMFRGIFRSAKTIQAISVFLADFAKEEGALIEPVVIGNGVSVEVFSGPRPLRERELFRKARGIAESDTVLITTSRLVQKNAVDVIIRSLSYLPMNVRLLVVGNGPEHDSLVLLAQEGEVHKRVYFAGTIPHKELPIWYHASDVFVRPSRSEGFGNVFAEAMASGVPVIATAVGGIPDIVKDGETGVICQVDDPKDLAEKIHELINNRPLLDKIVVQGKKLVKEQYDWSIIAERIKKECF